MFSLILVIHNLVPFFKPYCATIFAALQCFIRHFVRSGVWLIRQVASKTHRCAPPNE